MKKKLTNYSDEKIRIINSKRSLFGFSHSEANIYHYLTYISRLQNIKPSFKSMRPSAGVNK